MIRSHEQLHILALSHFYVPSLRSIMI